MVTVSDMSSSSGPSEVRRQLLSVAITEGIDFQPRDRGVLVAGRMLTWSALDGFCGPHPADSPAGRRRICVLLRLHAWAARLPTDPDAATRAVAGAARMVAVPVDHVDHLGPGWIRRPVAGGALWCGLGIGLTRHDTMPLPPDLLVGTEIDLDACWQQAYDHAWRASTAAAQLFAADGPRSGVLGPVGELDVLGLLATDPLRHALASGDGIGMRSVAVPDRRHAWYDLTRIDPAYLPLAWSLTDPGDRGVQGPLLITRDEVTAVRPRRPADRDGGPGLTPPWVERT